jgi:membrane protease YdiL (CAAX protease family)
MTDSWLRRIADDFLAPLRAAHEEQLEYLQSRESERFDTRTAATLVTVAVVLTLQKYGYLSNWIESATEWFSRLAPDAIAQPLTSFPTDPQTSRLAGLTWWALGQVIGYLLIPGLIIKFVFRERLSDYGLKLQGMFSGSWIYLVMYLIMVGPILWASTRPSFLRTYPFYQVESGAPFWPRMIAWELLYALQFVALEFFFRGFMLHGCRRRFGAYSMFAMAVPYCMIHYSKPLLETLGAIAAGVILGYMSLRTRSIWLGAALHIAVAWTMDAAAIWQGAK